jgi:tetratricopeptide (TPR) repeat protein
MLGVIYHQSGRLAEAEGMFQRALQINPAYTEAALNLAVTYNDLGKYREAKEVYQRALMASKSAPQSLDPFAKGKIANMHADIGAAYHAVGMYADAVREYERALSLCPTFVDIRTRLGTTLREMGNAGAAVVEFERVKAENPRFLSARLHLGLSPCWSWRPRTNPPRCTWRCSSARRGDCVPPTSPPFWASPARRSAPPVIKSAHAQIRIVTGNVRRRRDRCV